MSNEKILLIGSCGQVGRTIFQALKRKYEILEYDLKQKKIKNGKMIDLSLPNAEENQGIVIHICIPFTKDFINIVKEYDKIYKPRLIIIHSTVELGTTKKLFDMKIPIVHSPILFNDNYFATSTNFRKMIGYDNNVLALCAEAHLRKCFSTALICNSIQTELADILIGLYSMSCRAITFEMAVIFKALKCDYNVMMEMIHYNNVGYGRLNNLTMLLQNMTPDLNKEDYRVKLIELLPEKAVSLFFKLAQKSYGLEKQEKENKQGEKINDKPEKVQ